MRSVKCLSSVATALLLTTALAVAQNAGDKGPSAAPQAGSQDLNARSNAGADKMERPASRADRPNQATPGHGTPGQAKTGQAKDQSNQATKDRRGTTGQAVKDEPKRNASDADKSKTHSNKMRSSDDKRGTTAQSPKDQPNRAASDDDRNKTAGDAKKNDTTGQATKDESTRQKSNADRKSTTGTGTSTTQQTSPGADKTTSQSTTQQPGNTPTNTASDTQQRTGANQQPQGVNLTTQQQTRIRETVFTQRNVPRVDRVDFALRVGVPVPPRVHLVTVPPTFIEIHPEWRGHQYFVVRDEIVIVDDNRHVVAVIPSSGRVGRTSSDDVAVVDLSPDQIRVVQTVLIDRGYLQGEADGVFGPQTQEALVTFQRREGMEVTGRIDTRTISSLGLSDKIQVNNQTSTTTGQGINQQPRNQNAQQPSTTQQTVIRPISGRMQTLSGRTTIRKPAT
jgi:hypothetical protein